MKIVVALVALAMICVTWITCTIIIEFHDAIENWIIEKSEHKKAIRKRQLTDGIKVQIDGKKVAEAMQGIDPRANRDNTPGV